MLSLALTGGWPMPCRHIIDGGIERRTGRKSLHPASSEIPLVGGILHDVGGVALLSDVLRLNVLVRRVLRDNGRVLGTLRASIGRRNGWHMRAHGSSPIANIARSTALELSG